MISKGTPASKTALADDSNSYFSYLWSLAKSHGLYKLGKRFANYFSKFRIISFTVKIIGFIFVAIETSAVIFIVTVVFLVLLPPFIIGFVLVIICASLNFKHDIKRLAKFMDSQKAIVFFTERGYKFKNDGFLARNALELANRSYRVIIVTPFVLSSASFGNDKRYFFNLKETGDGIAVIRQQFFFHAKKHLFKNYPKRIIYVY